MKKCFIFLFACLMGNVYNQTPSQDTLKSWMHFLSADERKGRDNGSVEAIQVADWLADKLEKSGVKTLPGSQWLFHDYQNPNGGMGLTNVIGYIPGKSEDSYIILSAHYDHIGVSRSGGTDPIYNGADDDASGICMLLGIAGKIYADTNKPECSIIIAAFSGEEIGLLGSEAFCKSNVIAWDKVKANLNFELTGRSGELGKYKYYITGRSNSNLSETLNKFNENSTWKMTDVGYVADLLYRAADNYSFVKYVHNRKISFPAHTMATSVGKDYVHTVKDEEKNIDFDNLSELIDYTTSLVYYISQKDVILSCKQRKKD
jgi:Zn-dependent M28 family amino/carboxypeptidase